MVCHSSVTGMPIDLSSSPPKCDSCILGKQTHSLVPKMCEGARADVVLQQVFIDLCGPMPGVSCTGNVYTMNIIDDFSSYIWCVLLKCKSDASTTLQTWHHAVATQSSLTLKILVTDNGELISASTSHWCDTYGIDHQHTAPYMSAQNGHAECLHHTLFGCTCTMHLAFNAPISLWDEFCLTAAYLTNLTATSANHNKMPFKLWYSKIPSLSHLHEIKCCAFTFIQTNNPKIYCHSRPCMLIGYAPHSKSYCLWDNMSNSVFNLYHVTFIEHLDSQL